MRSAPVSFAALDDALVREIAAHGGVRQFPARTVVISESDTADTLYIILSGRVKVYSTNVEGREVVIATHGAGEYVGELALDGGTRSSSVMTLEPTTCSIVTGESLRRIIGAHPDFARHLIQKLIWRVRQATESVKSLALQNVYGRVVRLLYETSVDSGSHRRLKERLTQQDIADRVGSSREMVSRILRDLTRGGYVATVEGRITIQKQIPAEW